MNETQALLLAFSATLIGAGHTLIPGHWVPVVLMTRSKQWRLSTALLGALISSLGHILFSFLFGILAAELGVTLLASHEDRIERYSGLALGIFGLIYAIVSYVHQKRHCHDAHQHSHKKNNRKPFLFLFLTGLSPCVAVLPIFAAAAPYGIPSLALAIGGFAAGVIATLATTTALASTGLMKLNHPIIEKYGDTLTGVGVCVTGVILFLISV